MAGEGFFAGSPHDTLRQGDIFVAPTARLWTRASHDSPPVKTAPRPDLGEAVFHGAWSEEDGSLAPVIETRHGLAIVVSHDCDIEKEFNREVRRLIAEGMNRAEAIRRASGDPDLDRFVVVAPLRAYEEFAEADRPGLQSGQRIGYLPLEEMQGLGVELIADLTQLTTVERHMLTPGRKVASLSDAATAELRYKLSEAYAIRGLSAIAELEAMVGHTIVEVVASEKSRKKTALTLKLDDGSLMNLEVRKPRDRLPEEITRTTAEDET